MHFNYIHYSVEVGQRGGRCQALMKKSQVIDSVCNIRLSSIQIFNRHFFDCCIGQSLTLDYFGQVIRQRTTLSFQNTFQRITLFREKSQKKFIRSNLIIRLPTKPYLILDGINVLLNRMQVAAEAYNGIVHVIVTVETHSNNPTVNKIITIRIKENLTMK